MEVLRSIVLVDDDADDQEIFRTACAEVDNHVSVVGFDNGEQALESIPTLSIVPDMIFLDLNMPRLNGLEVLEQLKRNNDLKDIPVIIYTTSFDGKVKEKCDHLGAVDVIEKPNCFDSLCDKLKVLLEKTV
jgi:CheY-like chemotaxis protein